MTNPLNHDRSDPTDPSDTVASALLDWYATAKRDLPWRRRDHDPYAVWVSEIMLQQTTVAAVIPYYERWMAAFPTIADLARADLDDVLKFWAGLGYYARARNLHKAARQVVDNFGGVVPSDPATLQSLPGIGRYTAGAILSIAFDQDEPIVDANVIRVLTRLFAIDGDPKASTATQAQIWLHAENLIPSGRASEFNQSLMELGALVCNIDLPLCDRCPVRRHCAAAESGDPTLYPQFVKRDKWKSLDDVAVAVRNGRGEIALAKRPASASLWGGLWELPRTTRLADEELRDCAARAVREGIGVDPVDLRPFGSINHVVANRKITLHGFIADCPSGAMPRALDGHDAAALLTSRGGEAFRYETVAWEPRSAASAYAMSTPQVRLLKELAKYESQGRLEL